MTDDSHSIREIHKYGWLRILPQDEKKICVLPKKVWVVFCIHDEKLPYLEVYTDKRTAILHKPDIRFVLTDVLHISPTICPLDGEFEFVITVDAPLVRLIRLTAPSWNQMMAWIDGISSKLREMKILSPKENVYTSQLPEIKRPLLPTRDPNSPLPVPPTVPYIPPGVEPVPTASQLDSAGQNTSTTNGLTSRLMLTPEQMTRQTVVVDIEGDDEILQHYNGQIGSRTVIEVPPEYLPFDMFDLNAITDVLRRINTNGSTNNADSPPSSSIHNHTNNNDDNVNDNDNGTTEVSVTNGTDSAAVEERNTPDTNIGSAIGCQGNNIISNDEITSRNHQEAANEINENNSNNINANNSNNSRILSPIGNVDGNGAIVSDDDTAEQVEVLPTNTGNLYEHVFLPSTSSQALSVSNMPSVSQLPRMGRGRANQRGRKRNNINGENGISMGASICADRIRNTTGVPSVRLALDADRVRSPPPALMIMPHRLLQPAPQPAISRQVDGCELSQNHPTLREQQVMQLRREMTHPAGVKLQLRKKDSSGSIAFIDAFQSVWIAGWKQKEHPILYNALHIGDQLISIAGKAVYNSADAQKMIRTWPSLYIEFVIRRVPCGRVFALRRDFEGQSLGIVQEGNTAEIKDVLSNSIAASHGLSSRTPTMDGLSLCTWFLTEINARPLNLSFKDNEVKDRLNAVGLDISLLVQPSDLIKQIKKQLKNIKNYKEYLLQ